AQVISTSNCSDKPTDVEYPMGEAGVTNDLTTQVLLIRTTVRYWQDRISQRIKANDWPVSKHADAVLTLTIYGKMSDEEIAIWLNGKGNKEMAFSAQSVRLMRAEAILVLLKEYSDVLDTWGARDDTSLSGIYQNINEKLLRFQEYTKGHSHNVKLGRD